jgi:hypothetical protein
VAMGRAHDLVRAPIQGASQLVAIPRAKALGYSVSQSVATAVSPHRTFPFAVSPTRR